MMLARIITFCMSFRTKSRRENNTKVRERGNGNIQFFVLQKEIALVQVQRVCDALEIKRFFAREREREREREKMKKKKPVTPKSRKFQGLADAVILYRVSLILITFHEELTRRKSIEVFLTVFNARGAARDFVPSSIQQLVFEKCTVKFFFFQIERRGFRA